MVAEKIQFIDTHTAGEPTRIIIDGFPHLEGETISDRRDNLVRHHDHLRSGIVREPRGHEAMVAALLLDSSVEECTAGVIFFNNVGVLGMCGHGAIGVVKALHHMGKVEAGSCKLETPVGIIETTLHPDGEVSVRNVRSYRFATDVSVTLDDGNEVTGDIAWGGNWFFITESPGIPIDSAHIDELIGFCCGIRSALESDDVTAASGALIDHVEVHQSLAQEEGPGVRSFVLCPGKEWDRSPCGTGTSATLACLHASGQLTEGESWIQVGPLGTRFTSTYSADGNAIYPTIRGNAYVSGEGWLHFSEDDPFRHGIDSIDL
ncbi:MAG: proline racemase family protein [Planctomycetota bacterium]|nr:proline racemase family protein [Planctomycetota bacterium]